MRLKSLRVDIDDLADEGGKDNAMDDGTCFGRLNRSQRTTKNAKKTMNTTAKMEPSTIALRSSGGCAEEEIVDAAEGVAEDEVEEDEVEEDGSSLLMKKQSRPMNPSANEVSVMMCSTAGSTSVWNKTRCGT